MIWECRCQYEWGLQSFQWRNCRTPRIIVRSGSEPATSRIRSDAASSLITCSTDRTQYSGKNTLCPRWGFNPGSPNTGCASVIHRVQSCWHMYLLRLSLAYPTGQHCSNSDYRTQGNMPEAEHYNSFTSFTVSTLLHYPHCPAKFSLPSIFIDAQFPTANLLR